MNNTASKVVLVAGVTTVAGVATELATLWWDVREHNRKRDNRPARVRNFIKGNRAPLIAAAVTAVGVTAILIRNSPIKELVDSENVVLGFDVLEHMRDTGDAYSMDVDGLGNFIIRYMHR